MAEAGRLLLAVGVVMLLLGGALILFGRFQLPGDFTFRTGGVSVYIPIATSIIVSVVLTIVLNFLLRHR